VSSRRKSIRAVITRTIIDGSTVDMRESPGVFYGKLATGLTDRRSTHPSSRWQPAPSSDGNRRRLPLAREIVRYGDALVRTRRPLLGRRLAKPADPVLGIWMRRQQARQPDADRPRERAGREVSPDKKFRMTTSPASPTFVLGCNSRRGLSRSRSAAQIGSIVRGRKIEDRAQGHDPSRIYRAMALVIVSLRVVEIDCLANPRCLKEIACIGP
jgi:hypothetical protein